MGSKKKSTTPPPTPEIIAPPKPPVEVDLMAQEEYLRQVEGEKMSVASTLLTSPLDKKKKKKDNDTMMGGY